MDLAELQVERGRAHRVEPPAPLANAVAAAEFIRERQIVMTAGRSSLPVIVEAIAGRTIRGSWMAQPEAHAIYRILGELERTPGLYEAALVLGKGCRLASGLAPAVHRIAADEGRRAEARSRLTAAARALLERVEAEAGLRMDATGIPTREARPARQQLERELLVVSRSLHTESGRHTALVMPWSAGRLAGQASAAAAGISLAEAESILLEACLASAVAAPETEVRRWFSWSPARVDALLAGERLVRPVPGWLGRATQES